MNIEQLKKENLELKKKLAVAQLWMEKEVKSQVHKVCKRRVSKLTTKTKDTFFAENIENIITTKVSNYFWELMLLNTPSSVIDNIISAEINYFNLRENPTADGLGVVSSYHKALDVLMESFITKWFRKFAIKNKQTQLRQNDPLEKSLNSVVNKWYTLSLGRLFHIIKLIKDDDTLYDYWKCFKKYLDKYKYIWDILYWDDFFNIYEELISSEILGKKRHVWKISFVETRSARKLLIWDFKNEMSLIYKFIEIWKVDY